jgi:aspartate aminotransferase
MLSKLVSKLKPSPTLALAAKAKELKASGKDVISLTVGEPDWETYDVAKEAGINAINNGITRYTPASGNLEIKEAVVKLINDQLGTRYNNSNVTVTAGAKFILFSALNSLLDPDDEVLLPSPYWVSYTAMIDLCRAKAVILESGIDSNFKVTAKQIENLISDKTKVLMLNSPSNPTGMVYTEKELREIADVLLKHPKVAILSDDIYNQLCFNEEGFAPHLLKVEPSLVDRCVCINGVSKAYAMTGWRIGWATGPDTIIKAMTNFQSQALGAASSISQMASAAALNNAHSDVKETLIQLKQRRSFGFEKLNSVPGFTLLNPEGAFYFWISISDLMSKSNSKYNLKDSRAYSQALLEEKNVVVVPGQEFGCDGFIRISYAVENEAMEKAVERLTDFNKSFL